MTVTYTAEVATCHKFGCFLKLLVRWKGSIYKLVWMDLIVFLTLYYALSGTYRFALDPPAKEIFESLVHYCQHYTLIPLSFVLGFYVQIVMGRWWDQYMTIPWPDSIAVYVSAFVHGQDDRGRVMRRTVMRYVCLCQAIVFTLISPSAKKRFPTWDHLVEAGLLLENEKEIIEGMNRSFPKHPKHWMAIVWAASIITRARKEGRIRDDIAVKTIIDELNRFRGQCGILFYFDTISIPLVYTQVVTLAVYTYFLCSVMGQQWIERTDESGYKNFVDLYFPIFTTLQFFFYMGWLKVAETLINPFGDDDDDFEVNWMIDRNLQVSYLIVDEMHQEHPELVKDQYWDQVFPDDVNYEPPENSTARLDISKLPPSSSAVRIDIQSAEDGAPGLRNVSSAVSNLLRLKTKTQQTPDTSNSTFEEDPLSPVTRRDDVVDRDGKATSFIPKMDEIYKKYDNIREDDDSLSFDLASSLDELKGSTTQDDFEALRLKRERQRNERQKQKLTMHLGAELERRGSLIAQGRPSDTNLTQTQAAEGTQGKLQSSKSQTSDDSEELVKVGRPPSQYPSNEAL